MSDNSNNNNKENKQSILTKETFGVVIALFATLCLVCLITREKVFFTPGQIVNAFFLGLFGWFSYVVLFYAIYKGITMVFGKKIKLKGKTKALIALGVSCLAIFCHLLSMGAPANYESYGQYLSLSYSMGAGGLISSSAGGIITGLITYPIALLLSVAGGCVLSGGALGYIVFLLVRSKLKAEKQAKPATPRFRSSYAPEPAEDFGNIKIEGEIDYPIENVNIPGSSNQRLFVNNPDDFGFKTKKDIAKNNDAQIKINLDKSGMGVPSYGASYSEKYSEEMQRKLDYIKTPTVINFNEKLNDYKNSNADSGARISDMITRNDQNEREIAEIEQKATSLPFDEPAPPVMPSNSQTTEQEASAFQDKYVNSEEIEEASEVIKPPRQDADRTNIFGARETASAPSFTEQPKNSSSIFGIPNFDKPEATIEEIKEEPKAEEIIPEPTEVPAPTILRERRSRQIIFGGDFEREKASSEPEEKENKEEINYTSNVIKDGNATSNANNTSNPFERAPLFSKPVESEKPIEEEKPKKVTPPINRKYFRPPLDLLETTSIPAGALNENHTERIEKIKNMLEDFHISVEPLGYIQGPSITRYEFKMPAGITVKRILGYDDDLKMCLQTKYDVRIEAPIPGKNAIGIEVANEHKAPVGLRDILEASAKNKEKKGALTFALGKDIIGNAITDDLAECKHFLVAGSTGSGKSVCMNVMLVSLIMRYSPEELRLILIDPKGVEFKPYEHIPHLMIDEIIAEPKKALAVFHWAYEEMEKRYKMFQEHEGVVDIDGYNEVVANSQVPKLPRIAIFVDELSNLMETCKKEMDARILSIAQKARAAGIHLVLATQRPSVDVITGTIKANLPSRIALKLMTFADSNTIISEGGAEKLLGYGDMLYRNSGMSGCNRYQGAFISRREVNNVVKYIKENNVAYFDDEMQEYLEKAVRPKQEEVRGEAPDNSDMSDAENSALFKKALWLSVNSGTVAISQLQRRFQIGYARAGGLVDKMERLGYVSGNEGSKARRVVLTVEEFIEKFGPMDDPY